MKARRGNLVLGTKEKRVTMFPDMDAALLRAAVAMRCARLPVTHDQLLVKIRSSRRPWLLDQVSVTRIEGTTKDFSALRSM